MYVAINSWKIAEELDDVFEEFWHNRDSLLKSMNSFLSFNFTKGELQKGSRLNNSHSTWKSKCYFAAWIRSK